MIDLTATVMAQTRTSANLKISVEMPNVEATFRRLEEISKLQPDIGRRLLAAGEAGEQFFTIEVDDDNLVMRAVPTDFLRGFLAAVGP